MPSEIEEFATQIEEAAEKALKVRFNPLAFTMAEVNQLLAEGAEPLPPSMWYLPDNVKERQIQEDKRRVPPYRCPSCGTGMSRRAFGCGPSGCSNLPC